jgi:sigma-B regulation protein RsbU (phosphoserine phosphatase)
LQTGVRIVQLQQNLEKRVTELENALAQVNHLSGLLPICCYCKNIRDDQNYWQRVEDYVSANTEVRFSHGICPNCYKAVVEPQLAQAGIAP